MAECGDPHGPRGKTAHAVRHLAPVAIGDGRVGAVTVFPCTDPQNWGPAIDEAVNAVSRGALIVLPTDTVYGIGTDAFSAAGVNALLEAKGRTRQSPPPVLVADQRTLTALTVEVP